MKLSFKFPKIIFLIASCLPGLMISCDHPGKEIASSPAIEVNDVPGEIPFKQEELPVFITYHLDSISTSEEVENFKTKYSEEVQQLIFALNRMDASYLNAGKVLIVPDTITGNYLDYSPFPRNLEMLNGIPKTVIISRRVQVYGLYERNNLIKWGPVSSGKESTPTPAGIFYGNHKAKRKVSTVNDAWILPYYFNFMNFEGVGVHQYAMPGYPASHACVRLYMEDAMEIYNWAEQWKLDKSGREILRNGTPFMVFGDYEFKQPVPWLDLAENPNSNYLSASEMEILKSYVNTYFKDKRNFEPPGFPEDQLVVNPEARLEANLE